MAKKNSLEQQLGDLDRLKSRGVITEDEYAARRTAILASPAAAAEPKGGSGAKGIFKWGFFGCFGILGALVAVVVLVIIIAAAASSGDDDSGTPGQVGTNKGDVHVALATNSAGVIAPDGNDAKKVQVTILQIAPTVKSSNQFAKPAEGKKWWGAEVVVENVGTKEVTSVSWKLRDSKDIETDRAFVVGADQELESLYNLTPGGKTQGWIYFEIATDANPKWLRADPNMFLKNDLYFDAP